MRISDWVQTCALPILRAFPLSWKRHSIIAPVREYRPMMIRPFLKRAMLRLATAFALLITGYWAAGLIGGAIPAHAGWRPPAQGIPIDRKSVVEGKSVSGRVDHGGRRVIKKKKKT